LSVGDVTAVGLGIFMNIIFCKWLIQLSIFNYNNRETIALPEQYNKTAGELVFGRF